MKTSKSPANRSGRRTARDPRADGQVTRSRILEAAGALMSKSGYAHTTAKAIAEHADVSLASINYHFESREGLYRAVLVEAHQRFVSLSDLVDLAGSKLSAADKLKAFIGQLVRQATSTRSGWHLDVVAREILAPTPHLSALTQVAVPPKLAVIAQVLTEITGIPMDDPALLRCHLSAVAPCTALLLMARGAPGALQDIRKMPQEVVTDHLHRFAMAGLKAARDHYARSSKSVRGER